MCPTYVIRKKQHRYEYELEAPFFPGYLFCRVASKSCEKIITTVGVVRIVGFGNTPTRIDDTEIERVKRIAASPIAKTPWRYLPAGCRVRIESGPLEGLEGFLEQDSNGSKLVVSVTMLCRSIAAVLDPLTTIVPLLPKRVECVMKDEERVAMRLSLGA